MGGRSFSASLRSKIFLVRINVFSAFDALDPTIFDFPRKFESPRLHSTPFLKTPPVRLIGPENSMRFYETIQQWECGSRWLFSAAFFIEPVGERVRCHTAQYRMTTVEQDNRSGYPAKGGVNQHIVAAQLLQHTTDWRRVQAGNGKDPAGRYKIAKPNIDKTHLHINASQI